MSVDSDIGPFAIVPEWLLHGVSPQALALFAELALHADRKSAKAWPSRARLAERLNVTTKTIDRSMKELVDIGAVEKQHRRDDSGWHSSLYLVKYVSPPSAMESPTPSPTDVPQNQNHSEPEPRTISKDAPSAADERPSPDQFYLAEKISQSWGKRLGMAAIQKLNTAYGRETVENAMRELHGFPPSEAIRSPFAYLEAICTQEVSA